MDVCSLETGGCIKPLPSDNKGLAVAYHRGTHLRNVTLLPAEILCVKQDIMELAVL